ncbi:uncharacterized protein LOC129233771, partial [Uloborus diversus]|uniref:uncharacterized protein LOC129233771 n=1 Tax=Uloborus diversus TaxID=327109 RepID=UPI002409A1AE
MWSTSEAEGRRQRARAAARRRSDERLEQLRAATDEAQVVTTEVRAATSEAREAKVDLVQATSDGQATKAQMEAAASNLRNLMERIPESREEVAESAPYVDPTPPGEANIDATRRRLQFGDPSVSGESVAPSDTDSTPKDTATPAATAAVLPSSGSLVPSDTDSTPPACSSFAAPASTPTTTLVAAPMLSDSGSAMLSVSDSTPSGSQGGPATPRRSPRLKEKAEKSPPRTPVKSPASTRRKSQD